MVLCLARKKNYIEESIAKNVNEKFIALPNLQYEIGRESDDARTFIVFYRIRDTYTQYIHAFTQGKLSRATNISNLLSDKAMCKFNRCE